MSNSHAIPFGNESQLPVQISPLAKYQSPQQLQERVDDYFHVTEQEAIETKTKLIFTYAGLGMHIGLSRKQILEYEARDQYRNIIQKARQRLEHQAEYKLLAGEGGVGPIFWLKNNANYVDVKQVQQKSELVVHVNLTGELPEEHTIVDGELVDD
jgi:hypothetical protein